MSLYSERMGIRRTLNDGQLYNVVSSCLKEWEIEQLLLHALGGKIYFDDQDSANGTKEFNINGNLENPGMFFRRQLVHDMQFITWNAHDFISDLPDDLHPIRAGNLYTFFDFLEILHSIVTYPTMNPKDKNLRYSKSQAQKMYRDFINPDLALYQSPHQMLSNGQIVEVSNKPVVELSEQALQIVDTDGVPESVKHPIVSAVTNYIRRGSTLDEKKQAVRDLADALESIRSKVKANLLSSDENELFQIANNFAIRHNNPKQKTEYDQSIWYDWMFHVNLAALLTVIRIMQSQNK